VCVCATDAERKRLFCALTLTRGALTLEAGGRASGWTRRQSGVRQYVNVYWEVMYGRESNANFTLEICVKIDVAAVSAGAVNEIRCCFVF